jgi:hypothetical protein
VFFVVVGFLLPITWFVLVFRKPRLADFLGMIDASLLFLTTTEKTGQLELGQG